MSTFDLVLLLIIANAVQNAMVGPDTSLAGGLVAAGVLIGWDRPVGWGGGPEPGGAKAFAGGGSTPLPPRQNPSEDSGGARPNRPPLRPAPRPHRAGEAP